MGWKILGDLRVPGNPEARDGAPYRTMISSM